VIDHHHKGGYIGVQIDYTQKQGGLDLHFDQFD
jgi:hypothetical protein